MSDIRKMTTINIPTGVLLVLAVAASAQAQTVNQLLDSVFMNGSGNAAEMPFTDPLQRDPDFIDLGISGSDFRACKLTAIDGLFCLDGKIVRNWPNPSITVDVGGQPVVPSFDVVNCEDPALGLDARKADTCTGLTVDLGGNIWLAGKNKGKTHSLIQLVASIPPEFPAIEPSCPDPMGTARSLGLLDTNDALCGFEVATGRPLLVDIDPVDGDLAKNFSLPGHAAPLKAILGLEERKTAVAFLESGEVEEIASGKQDWVLIRSEQLLSITLLQLVDEDGVVPPQNIVLVTTTLGRVLAYDVLGGGPAVPVFDIPGMRESGTLAAGPCNSDDPVYSIRASSKTNLVYVTDSQYCEVVALQATVDGDGIFTGLMNATEGEPAQNLTLSTRTLTAPTGITVSPGVSIDLNDCADPATPCPLVVNAAGIAIAELSGVQLFNDAISGLSLFQIEGVPDCRYVPRACLGPLGLTDPGGSTADIVQLLIDENVIVPLLPDSGDELDPAAQRLNVTPLLPAEITDLFPEGLPPLLLSRYVRGQKISGEIPGDDDSGYRFGGFFGITQDGVIFRDTFEGVFDIGELAGESLGCADNLGTLLWDVIGTVSERYVSASDAYAATDPQYVTTIINNGCSSTKTIDDRWSLKPYNLEPTPCTFNPDAMGNWDSDGLCVLPDSTLIPPQPREEIADDAVYGKMLLILFDELSRTLDQLACADVYAENGGAAPLTVNDCATLQASIFNTVDKFNKCWDATQQPKQSSGNQTCQAFDSQLIGLQNELSGIMPVDPDVANRVGELKARAATIRHVFETRFGPSLPADGFVEPEPGL